MESYRHATYRYSTGQGFNPNVDTPERAGEVASYKMEPLRFMLSKSGTEVELKREADRLSMQVEAAAQQMKVLGYDATSRKKYQNLKARLEVLKHLMLNYPIKIAKINDLEKLYGLYAQGGPGMDEVIKKIVNENQGGTQEYVDTAMKVRKGYPLFDQYGRVLSKKEESAVEAGAKAVLNGFGEISGNNKYILGLAAAIALVLLYCKLRV